MGSLLRPPPGTLGFSRPPRKAGGVAAATGRTEVSSPEQRRLELELGHESQPPSGPHVPPCPLVADGQARDSRKAQKPREWAEAMWARPVPSKWEVILNCLFTALKEATFRPDYRPSRFINKLLKQDSAWRKFPEYLPSSFLKFLSTLTPLTCRHCPRNRNTTE